MGALKLLRERVRAGVTLLDEQRPDWWAHVDVDDLDLYWPEHCVLGQLFPTYYDGLRELAGAETSDVWAERHGFQLDLDSTRNYPMLNAIWRGVIRGRRAAWGW